MNRRIVAKIEELACTTNAVGDDLKGFLEDEQEDGRLHTNAIVSLRRCRQSPTTSLKPRRYNSRPVLTLV